MAAVGSSMGALHALASLGVRAGNRNLNASWTTFYFVRPLTGAGVAVMTYLVLASGIGGFEVTKPMALLAWAALAGLYSEQALTKLRDVFLTLLRPDSDRPGNDKPTDDKPGATAEPGNERPKGD